MLVEMIEQLVKAAAIDAFFRLGMIDPEKQRREPMLVSRMDWVIGNGPYVSRAFGVAARAYGATPCPK